MVLSFDLTIASVLLWTGHNRDTTATGTPFSSGSVSRCPLLQKTCSDALLCMSVVLSRCCGITLSRRRSPVRIWYGLPTIARPQLRLGLFRMPRHLQAQSSLTTPAHSPASSTAAPPGRNATIRAITAKRTARAPSSIRLAGGFWRDTLRAAHKLKPCLRKSGYARNSHAPAQPSCKRPLSPGSDSHSSKQPELDRATRRRRPCAASSQAYRQR